MLREVLNGVRDLIALAAFIAMILVWIAIII